MSDLFESLSDLETIDATGLTSDHRITLLTASGLVNSTLGVLFSKVKQSLELVGSDGLAIPSPWPVTRTLTLAGALKGTAVIDGTQDISLVASLDDESLPQAKVQGLTARLLNLSRVANSRWGTGYTTGPNPTSFGGNLNILSGATYLFTEPDTKNVPDTEGSFLVLQNGPQNYGQQLALRNGEGWLRGQTLGSWSKWHKLWTSGNLNPDSLLLKNDIASAAKKLSQIRHITLTGVVSANAVGFDGSGNVSLQTKIADGALTIAKVAGLREALDQRFQHQGPIALAMPLNLIKNSGIYIQANVSDVTMANNYPTPNTLGILRVTSQDTYVVQEYVTESNSQYRRFFDGGSWSSWTKLWTSVDFSPTSKFDKVGGDISGDVNIVGELRSTRSIYANTFINSDKVTSDGIWGLHNSTEEDRSSGMRFYDDGISLAIFNAKRRTSPEFKLWDDGRLTFNGRDLLHSGNFDASNPVPAGGILNVGDPLGKHLRFRSDGRYTTDGGQSWRELNEAAASVADPKYRTLAIGEGTEVLLTEDTQAGGLIVRTGDSVAFKTFTFHSNGNFLVPDGRVLIGGHEAWHRGSFDPSTKLGATDTAASATKLATARLINGVRFDGTTDITILAETKLPDSGVFTGCTVFDINTGTTGKIKLTAPNSNDVGLDAINDQGDGFVGLRIRASGLTLNGHRVLHSGNFNPDSKVNRETPLLIGVTTFDVNNGSTAKLRVGASDESIVNGIVIESLEDDLSGRAPLNLRGSVVTVNDSLVWTEDRFDPLTKQDARPELNGSAAIIEDWDNAVFNGWYVGLSAENAPNGLAGEFLGSVTRFNENWVQQVAHQFKVGAKLPGAKWRRWKIAGVWGLWTQDEFYGGTLNAKRIAVGWDSGNNGSISCNNWFRTTGPTGVYFSDFGGGVYMTDSQLVRAYNGKGYGASWFENTSDGCNPSIGVKGCAYRAYGQSGGGYGLHEGTHQIALYSDNGDLIIGFGEETVERKVRITKEGEIKAADFLTGDGASMSSRLTMLEELVESLQLQLAVLQAI
jgi:hypothetical protein